MKTCCVPWCNNTLLVEDRRNRYCDLHTTKYCKNRPSRPWLNYKVEKFNKGEECCEKCGWKPDPKLPERCRYGLFDVDHEEPELKGTPEGEQPSNYQLLCKNCHTIKSYMDGDSIPKKHR